ncbi:MAG: S49 family peptidase, partial [Pseudomonadota bacterium]
MPPWNSILNEVKATGSTHDVIRRKYLKKLSQLTRRNVITYYSGWLQKPQLSQKNSGLQFGIFDSDKNGFMAVIHGLDRSKGLDLLLHTPGGDMAATESLIDYLRAMFGDDFRAFVPQLAMSGGTIIALAANKIIMGKHSSIGPIDPQFFGMSATGLIKELKKVRDEIKQDQTAAYIYQPILSRLSPGQITECEDAISWAKAMAKRYLEANMLRDGDIKAKSIVDRLTEKSSTISHGRHIGID